MVHDASGLYEVPMGTFASKVASLAYHEGRVVVGDVTGVLYDERTGWARLPTISLGLSTDVLTSIDRGWLFGGGGAVLRQYQPVDGLCEDIATASTNVRALLPLAEDAWLMVSHEVKDHALVRAQPSPCR